jgi:hypothetical protein
MNSPGYKPLVEDPFYDEDGVLADEDYDWQDIDTIDPAEWDAAFPQQENYDPYATINS